jgi:hypothetical protein
MLAALRLTDDPNTDMAYAGDDDYNGLCVKWRGISDQPSNTVRVHFNSDFPAIVENVKSTFKCDREVWGFIALVGVVGLSSLPIQYKFLASYKVLELASSG